MVKIRKLFTWSVTGLIFGLFLFAIKHFPSDNIPQFMLTTWFYNILCLLLLLSGLGYTFSFCVITFRGSAARALFELLFWIGLGGLLSWFSELFINPLGEYTYYVLLAAALATVSRVFR